MSASAAQSAAAKALPKVLRIGVVVEGKIAQERLIRIGETVSVGESNRNSFMMTGTKLGEKLDIFVAKGDGYVLCAPEWVEGKISWKDGIRGLDELRTRGDGVKKGDLWHFTLDVNVRGKISIGAYTLLFQFVPAPPEPIRQVSAADFKPKFFDGDDPLFNGLLGTFTLIAAAFMVWIWTTPLPERSDAEMIEKAAALIVNRPIVVPKAVEEAPSDEPAETKPKDEKKPEESKDETKTEEAPKQDQPAQPQAPSKESVAKKSLLIQMLGSAGATGAGGSVADIIGDDSASMAGLDQALSGVSGVQAAESGATGGVKSGSAGGREDAKVGVGVVTGGKSGTGSGAAVTVKRAVVDVSASVDADVEAGDAGSIASVVKKSSSRISSCVDQALKSNPDLNGRVSVGWSIVGGKVTTAALVKNTTEDKALGECIVRAVKGFRFDPSLTAEVSEYPWVVSGQ